MAASQRRTWRANATLVAAFALSSLSLPKGAALASLVVDLRATSVSGGGTLVNGKGVTDAVRGTTITLQAWAQVTGSSGNTTPGIAQTVQATPGSFLSAGQVLGDLIPSAPPAVFGSELSSAGFSSDLDGDGDLDIGSNFIGSPANFFTARAAFRVGPRSGADGSQPSLVVHALGNEGWEYLVDTIQFVVTSGIYTSYVNFRPYGDAVLWAENDVETPIDHGDGTTGYNYSGGTVHSGWADYFAGVPVSVEAIPEPSLTSAILFGSLVALRRRAGRVAQLPHARTGNLQNTPAST